MDCSCAWRRLSLKAYQLSQAPLLFRAVSQGALPTSSLNKLMFALLKYRVWTLSPASWRRRGSWRTSWPLHPRLLLIITPLTSSFSFVSSWTRRAWPLMAYLICVKKLLLTWSRNLFGLLSSHCVFLSADMKEGEVFRKKLHCDLNISSSCLKRFHPVPHLTGWSITNRLLTLIGHPFDSNPQAWPAYCKFHRRAPYIWAPPSSKDQPILFFSACLSWRAGTHSSQNSISLPSRQSLGSQWDRHICYCFSSTVLPGFCWQHKQVNREQRQGATLVPVISSWWISKVCPKQQCYLNISKIIISISKENAMENQK